MDQPTDFKAAAAALKFETRAFINGKYAEAASGKTFATINPANGKVITNISSCEMEDVDRAVVAARRAFEVGDWSRRSPAERKKVLLKFADLIEANMEELALLETLDSGKPIRDARNVDLPDSIATLRWHAEATDKIYDQMSPAPHDVVSMIVREPIGVVGGVIPWNFPLFVAMWKLGPALAGGNSLILKPAELTSLSLLRLAGLASAAGLPDGVFNVVPGLGHEAGKAIGMHNDIDCVSFTGSGEVGRYFLEYSAKSNMKKIVLECGGKSPAIVMDDVKDLGPVVENLAMGILFCQGENCSAGSRLIVQEGIKDRLLEELKKHFAEWKVGDPFDQETKVGAMIEEKHLNKVLRLIDRGRKDGAKVSFGGDRVREETGGYFVEPTIFEGVTNDMMIAREEIFGPVLSVISVKTEEEAIKIANDTNYGLASQLYTDNLNVAHRVAKAIRAGTVSVNCFSEGDLAVPFGGYKESGFGGRDKGLAAHDQYTEQKAIWIQLR
ncbi:aldehyde dehydrogenase [Sinorhizobium sp. 7-81]|uniref:aldehyde dehydrogenase n=1 Tax=Sinorhizobium sp. 8-89 TaxID=3049089 RepID=UPI0024C3D438|nr:aldehyde dehydrogenase [Sinorhizobium sp. 8-89]MDK1492933.1 aldehyde dehydrogenase [Sinorhizobium sp. 8-89]